MTPSLYRFEAVGPTDALAAAYERATAEPPLALAASLFEHGGPGTLRLELIFDAFPERDAVLAALGLADGAVETSLGALAPQDWVALSLAGLPAIEAGRFRLRGGHQPAAGGGGINLLIEAGEAFGTGHHATTRGCLLAIHDLLKPGVSSRRPHSASAARLLSRSGPLADPHPLPPPRKGEGIRPLATRPDFALDLGTGTGALAIAVARATRRGVLATDIDPIAVDVARDNVRLNGATGLVRVIEADGLRSPELRGRRFGLVIANILAAPLHAMAGDLVGACAPGGTILLSGLLEPQARGVTAAYRARGARLARRYVLEGWATLVLRR
jgi:ribosomal protein L11 methyltransferase